MKKFYLSFALQALVLGAFAQQVVTGEKSQFPFDGKVIENKRTVTVPQKNYKTYSATERWYNFAYTMDAIMGKTQRMMNVDFLFPDSTIIIKGAQSNFVPSVHAIADVLDVTSPWLNDLQFYSNELQLTKKSSFSVDTIECGIVYVRKDTSVTDTLLFEVAVNNTDILLPNNGFAGATAKLFNVDTVFFKDIPFDDSLTFSLYLPNKVLYKIPLTNAVYADSTPNGLHYISVPTPNLEKVQPGKYVVTSVKFLPGYTWVPNQDTLNKKNYVLFLSSKEQNNSYMQNYVKRDFNVSYILPKGVRYKLKSTVDNGWKGVYIPSLAYQNTFPFEHHEIAYKVHCVSNCDIVSISNITKMDNMILGDVYPNPSGKYSVIPYELSRSAKVTLEIYDITGRKLLTLNEGNKASGKHTISFDASRLAKGIYFYTLKADDTSLTKRMVVGE